MDIRGYSFKYEYNFKIFELFKDDAEQKTLETDDLLNETRIYLEDVIHLTETILKLDSKKYIEKIREPSINNLIKSYTCLALPPYSPYISYEEILIESPLRTNINIISRNILSILIRLMRCANGDILKGLSFLECKYMLGVFNMYYRNNDKIIKDLLKTCTMLNDRFINDMLIIAKALVQKTSDESEMLRMILDTFTDNISLPSLPHSRLDDPLIANRTVTPTDYNKIFVNDEFMLLDMLGYLEVIFNLIPDGHYDSILTIDVDTPYTKSNIEHVLTNSYYLTLYIHQLLVETNKPLYDIHTFNCNYNLQFQTCVYYRCKITLLKLLLNIIKFNVSKNPDDSADYCFNWLIIFTKMGGEPYNINRGVILEDLEDVNFTLHVDEWSKIHNNWLKSEITQIKSVVSINESNKQVNQNILKIKEVTAIEDVQLIKRCLNIHDNDIDATIVDLINNHPDKNVKITSSVKKPIDGFSLSYLPNQNKQVIMNYWDFINREDSVYNDDVDDELHKNISPFNLNQALRSEEEETVIEGTQPQRGKKFYRIKENNKAHYSNHHRRDRHRKKMQSGI